MSFHNFHNLQHQQKGNRRQTFSEQPVVTSEYHQSSPLTGREQEVLYLVAKGYTDRRIAAALAISPRTVNRHLSNIFCKLGVSGRAAAVAIFCTIGYYAPFQEDERLRRASVGNIDEREAIYG